MLQIQTLLKYQFSINSNQCEQKKTNKITYTYLNLIFFGQKIFFNKNYVLKKVPS